MGCNSVEELRLFAKQINRNGGGSTPLHPAKFIAVAQLDRAARFYREG